MEKVKIIIDKFIDNGEHDVHVQTLDGEIDDTYTAQSFKDEESAQSYAMYLAYGEFDKRVIGIYTKSY